MEITKAAFDAIADRASSARQDKQLELEANFVSYNVGLDAFRRVLAALGSKLEKVANEPTLDITPENARSPRLSVRGQEAIAALCQSGSLSQVPLEAMVAIEKLDAGSASKAIEPVKLSQYGITFNLRREIPIDDVAGVIDRMQPAEKQFRYKQRTSFKAGDFRIDCTVVHRHRKVAADVLKSNLLSSQPAFEIEIEYQPATTAKREKSASSPEKIAEGFLNLASHIYQNLEASPYPLTQAKKGEVVMEYVNLVAPLLNVKVQNVKLATIVANPNTYFVGPKPVSFERENLHAEAGGVLKGYTVTDKADGERHMFLVASDGACYVINNRFHVRFTGLRVSKDDAGTLLDGELIERFKVPSEGAGGPQAMTMAAYMAFDAYYFRGDLLAALPLHSSDVKVPSRLAYVDQVGAAIKKHGGDAEAFVQFRKKRFEVADGAAMFKVISQMLDADKPYETDGLIFTPANMAVGATAPGEPPKMFGTWRSVLKWKPPEQNTIDFIVRMSGDVTRESGEVFRHTRLFVGAKAGVDTLDIFSILSGAQQQQQAEGRQQQYVQEYGESEYAEVFLALTDGKPLTAAGEQLMNNTVVEFAWHDEAWKPLRIRHDKTQLYLATRNVRGTANDIEVANRVWSSIQRPVTTEMIRGDVEMEVESISTESTNDDQYYVRDVERANYAIKPMNKFHTVWIKGETLFKPLRRAARANALLDMGCGMGGDLSRYAEAGFKVVVGLDYSEDNIINPKIGIYARYVESRAKNPVAFQGKRYVFAQWDGSKAFDSGYDMEIRNPELRDLARTLFETVDKSQLRQGMTPFYGMGKGPFDVVSCMFAIHYFFGSRENLRTFLKNVASSLRPGGIFMGTCMDGEKVDSLLKKNAQGIARGTKANKIIWSITARYFENGGFDSDAQKNIGKQIDVYIESIGKEISEFLVDFRLLVDEAKEAGLHLASKSELREFGMGSSATGLFSEPFQEMLAALKTKKIERNQALSEAAEMTADEKTLSFMNRFFVFCKD